MSTSRVTRYRRFPRLIAVTLGLFLTGETLVAQSPPTERYYITLFGAQSVPFQTRHTHTWATFVRTLDGPDGEYPVEVQTISWMPATLQIHPLALRREPGVNLSLGDTFAWVGSFQGRVSVWGPYQISADDYSRYLARKAHMESGSVAYRALGTFTGDLTVSNCGQSFTRASPILSQRYRQPTPSPGENGTSRLALRYIKSGALPDPGTTHDWLLPLIGTDQYPHTHRQPGERVPYFRR